MSTNANTTGLNPDYVAKKEADARFDSGETLRPCPFCGSEAEIIGSEFYGFSIFCQGRPCFVAFGFQCGCDSEYRGEFKTQNEAAKAWNKRT